LRTGYIKLLEIVRETLTWRSLRASLQVFWKLCGSQSESRLNSSESDRVWNRVRNVWLSKFFKIHRNFFPIIQLLNSKLVHILLQLALQKERLFLISFQMIPFNAICAIFIVGSLSIQNENGVVQNYIHTTMYLLCTLSLYSSKLRIRTSKWTYYNSEGIYPCSIIILRK